jgi:hypothetical protein
MALNYAKQLIFGMENVQLALIKQASMLEGLSIRHPNILGKVNMVSDRLKTELAELQTKILDIGDGDTFSPENFKCVCNALKNLQSIVIELVQVAPELAETPT